MKRFRYQHIFALLALCFTLGLQSCLKDQADIFDKASSLRLQEYMDKTQETLASAPNGWVLDVYPIESQAIGGFAYTLKFDKEKCEVRTMMYKDSVKTSYYKMTAEVGSAISFDTYNWLMHYFSNPSFQNIEAFRGDFIFVVDSLSDNLIKVHGARTKNVMYLRKLEVPAEEYIQNTAAFKTAFTKKELWAFKGNEEGKDFDAEIDPFTQHITINNDGQLSTTAIAFTDKGVRTYKPVKIGNSMVDELVFNQDANNFVAKRNDNTILTCQAEQPTWMKEFFALKGNYILHAKYKQNGRDYEAEIDVELNPNSDYTGYTMSGLVKDYEVKAVFDRQTRTLGFLPQFIMTLDNGIRLAMFSYSKDKGAVGYDKEQINVAWDNERKNLLFKPTNINGETYTGWIMVAINSNNQLALASNYQAASPYLFGRAFASLDQLISLERDE